MSRDAKSSSKQQEQGALALKALHKQVLPFVLRRMKQDVLDDLPPKIIQDYYCDLSSVQKIMYDDMLAKSGKEIIQQDGSTKKTHVFQVLQYLRKLCNHPALVYNDLHPKRDEIKATLASTKSTIKHIENAPKLLALK